MRRASSNVGVITEHGISLLSFGYDHCAEHEFGIKRLRAVMGVSGDEADLTVQRLAVTKADETNLTLVEADVTVTDYTARRAKKVKHRRLYLLGGEERPYNQTVEQFVTGYRDSYPQADKPEAFWDEGAFLFSAPIGSDDERVLRDAHTALLAQDALLYQASSGNPFGGAGLVIVRRSTLPAALVEAMEAGFRDQKALKDAAEATGIRKRVDEWGKTRSGFWGSAYHALKPKWMFDARKAESAHPVIFWLNPTDQQGNNYGWFTVEELEQWMKGHGPIPKAAQKTA